MLWIWPKWGIRCSSFAIPWSHFGSLWHALGLSLGVLWVAADSLWLPLGCPLGFHSPSWGTLGCLVLSSRFNLKLNTQMCRIHCNI